MRTALIAWRCRTVLGLCLVCAVAPAPAAAASSTRGAPFTRSYSHEDIGNVPRGSRLGFDRFGRLAVIHDAIYAVLNDSVWINLAEPGGRRLLSMANVVQAGDGRSYFGARGAWGHVETNAEGRLHPVSLAPPHCPGWVATAVFRELIPTEDGVYFASWNGVVYLDFKRGTSHLFDIPRLSRMFQVGRRVYISSYDQLLRYIEAEDGTLRMAEGTALTNHVVKFATPLDETRSLLALLDGGLVVFDGRAISPWPGGDRSIVNGDVSVVQRLVDGRVALGVTGQGLLIFSNAGELLLALTTPGYRNVTELANREPGVLWVETEDAVQKILYGSPLSAFGQRLGLPVQWPLVALWKDRIVVASDGRLYRAVQGSRGEPTRFEPESRQPPGGAWAIAARGDRLLAGNGSGVYSLEDDGEFHPAGDAGDLAHLVMLDESRCFVIGRSSIGLLERRDGRWFEPLPRIAGIRNPAVAHRVGRSVWIEMGSEGVARLRADPDRLRLDVVPNAPGTEDSWVNVGAVGEIVVLSAAREVPRRFFDQRAETWIEAESLQRLLDRSPNWIARMQQDARGVIWATHNEGLVRFTPAGGDHEIDSSSFDQVNDRYPVVRILPNDDVWMLAERSLYHVERDWISAPATPARRPAPVSLFEYKRGEDLLRGRAAEPASLRFPYEGNGLGVRFYSGTDAWRRPPAYEFRLSEAEPWTPVDGSLIGLRGLREGTYRLEARIAGAGDAAGAAAPLLFEISPPWHRSRPAYLIFAAAALGLLLGAIRWSNFLERRRNRKLEEVVRERTRQLENAMVKLGDETRNAATLAERDRLASEIHDSVQQGLTGAILQLDSTLKMPVVSGEVRSRLNVVRNMVSYSRQEVEHAVWDMESPLLDGSELADALRNLTAFMNSREVAVDVAVSGRPVALGRAINHNLLRVAQEATTNALRHARAGRISITMGYETRQVVLEVRDDGIGFSPCEALQARGGHLGLRGMQARAKKMRGTFEIDSAPGAGTTLRVTVPVQTDEDPHSNAETRNDG